MKTKQNKRLKWWCYLISGEERTKDEPAPKLALESRCQSISSVAGICEQTKWSRHLVQCWWILDHQRLRESHLLQQGHRATPAAPARSLRTPLSSSRLSPFSFFSAKTNPTDPFQLCSPIPRPSVPLSVHPQPSCPSELFILRCLTPQVSAQRGRVGACRWKRVLFSGYKEKKGEKKKRKKRKL